MSLGLWSWATERPGRDSRHILFWCIFPRSSWPTSRRSLRAERLEASSECYVCTERFCLSYTGYTPVLRQASWQMEDQTLVQDLPKEKKAFVPSATRFLQGLVYGSA